MPYTLIGSQIPPESMRTYYKRGEDFLPFWNKELYVQDDRSVTMPSISIGVVIGITEEKILFRFNNNITQWLPLGNFKIKFFL